MPKCFLFKTLYQSTLFHFHSSFWKQLGLSMAFYLNLIPNLSLYKQWHLKSTPISIRVHLKKHWEKRPLARTFGNWKEPLYYKLTLTYGPMVLYMFFDRFLLAVESRDLSQADKSIIWVSSFPSWVMSSRTSFSVSQQLRPELSAK